MVAELRARWPIALAGAVAAALVTGIPTDLVPTPLFQRMTPVRPWDYPLWLAAAVLGGLLLSAASDPRCRLRRNDARRGLAGTALGYLAVGCPACNHLVVLALGTGGALSWLEPAQPFLGALGIALMALALRRVRVRPASAAVAASAPPGR